MATYYVRTTGSNSNPGTSAGAAWQTIAKAVSTVSGGDTVYIGAGVYRESVTFNGVFSSVVNFIGDFGGKFTGDVGEVRWTNHTNDSSASLTSSPLYLSGNSGKVAFSNITIITGGYSVINTSVGSYNFTDVTFTDCTFISSRTASISGDMFYLGQNNVDVWNWLFDRCRFLYTVGSTYAVLSVNAYQPSVTDTDINFVVQNCFFCGHTSKLVNFGVVSGYGGNLPGGFVFKNNTVISAGTGFTIGFGTWSTTNPVRVYGNMMVVSQFANLGTSGQLVEDYNQYMCNTTTVNVTPGSNSKVDGAYAFLPEVGQELVVGKLLRPFGTPTIDSPQLAFGSNSSYTTTVDMLNRSRPSGAGVTWTNANKGVGCYERHDFGLQDTSVYDGGAASMKLLGPGDQMIQVPVDATPTTISVKVRWDSNYGGGTKPQVTLLTNNEIGVSAETITASGSSATWYTLTLSQFTPTAKGVVSILLISSAAYNGVVNWDTMVVA